MYLRIERARSLILERFAGHAAVPTWQILDFVEAAHSQGRRNEVPPFI